MREVWRKLASRKLWMAVAGVVTGIAMALGVEESAVGAVAGAVTACVSVASYVLAEGRVDAAGAQAGALQVRRALEALGGESGNDNRG